jgi:F0F1-type ATP synthase delta subunit
MDTLDLSELFNTKAQAEDFSNRLTMISSKIFATQFNPEAAFLDNFGIKKKDAFMTLLRNNNVNPESRLAIKDFIEKIQTKIANMTVISLILAFEPKEETLQAFSSWFVINVNKQVLFDVTVDKTLVAGAAIRSGGKYLDFSIRPVLAKITSEVLVTSGMVTLPQK